MRTKAEKILPLFLMRIIVAGTIPIGLCILLIYGKFTNQVEIEDRPSLPPTQDVDLSPDEDTVIWMDTDPLPPRPVGIWFVDSRGLYLKFKNPPKDNPHMHECYSYMSPGRKSYPWFCSIPGPSAWIERSDGRHFRIDTDGKNKE